ncbi:MULTISPECIES: hypothetical protein [Mesorhizobium]|uniref:Uncharacterized protein n=2 Tax=Mesorhizobium TaxID=68287 RepID=A0A1A5ICT1_RHILI|nr:MULTISPECIES: hypothetical protein [Mesorhizobium]ETA72322.1 hypothetical protein MesloDRAFT_1192 [Mesorhizobium japonicum R7A]MBE1709654.1 hypothetical protein [Mesorhizobium japonicum]MBE1714323.1 hypothetical protein [Mesorhizobium japonicum]MUT25304.1 hypothetical protein [Mesorhizobium japonicum]MUT28642.1 hypothetical protein [Mesorhizobium japonicum]
MIKLTRFDGVAVEVKAELIVRVRQTDTGVLKEHGNSRVDGLVVPFYMDQPQTIADAVHAEIKTFTSLNQPGGKPVWFDGAKASGPVPLSSVNRQPLKEGKANSALQIGNAVQLVNNSPQEVYKLISDMGGNAEPPIDNSKMAKIQTLNKADGTETQIWDQALYADPTS